MKLAVQELTVAAPVEDVYALLTDAALFVTWMAEDATLVPVPGGVVRWSLANGDTVAGRFVELVPPRRVVFTYGWERREVGILDDRHAAGLELGLHGLLGGEDLL